MVVITNDLKPYDNHALNIGLLVKFYIFMIYPLSPLRRQWQLIMCVPWCTIARNDIREVTLLHTHTL